MNYYPEQLDALSDLCKALSDWMKNNPDAGFYFGQRISLRSLDDPGEVVGYLTDEAGSFSFWPAGGAAMNVRNLTDA
jgi:hypothetical protein